MINKQKLAYAACYSALHERYLFNKSSFFTENVVNKSAMNSIQLILYINI